VSPIHCYEILVQSVTNGVRIPPSPPLNSPIRHCLERQKASEDNAPGAPECAGVEACIPQCSPPEEPFGAPRAPAKGAGPRADVSGATAFHV
jgi:hypothetical protein